MLIEQLINSLRYLPGVGPKSAQRLAYFLLQHGRDKGLELAGALEQAIKNIGNCRRCNTLSETEFCGICSSGSRNREQLCIVETPIDVIAVEQTVSYKGLYFVLMGHLSPLDGIGPNEIGISELSNLLEFESKTIDEVILATNPTIEGEATAHYIANLIKEKSFEKSIKCSRIAHGIPMGGELEYIDSNTLSKAILGRIRIDE